MMDRGQMMAGRLMQGGLGAAPAGGFAGLATGVQAPAPMMRTTNAAPPPLATYGGFGGLDSAALQSKLAAGPQHVGGFSPSYALQNNDILPSAQGIAAPFASTISRPGTWVTK